MALPESVREVVERRVTALGDRARETLTAAAVIGRNFDLGLLAKLVEIGETELLDELEQAVAASLLAESTEKVGRFSFAHALISHTLYDGLGATRRARMHLQVAEALEDLYGTDSEEQFAELALHWRLATVSVDKAKAARYSLRAGQRALDNLAPEHARRWRWPRRRSRSPARWGTRGRLRRCSRTPATPSGRPIRSPSALSSFAS